MLTGEMTLDNDLIKNGNGFEKRAAALTDKKPANYPLNPAWLSFIRYCGGLQHGEIDRLKIQDGLPVLAEVTRTKVKFVP
jgi:hypothetical protein